MQTSNAILSNEQQEVDKEPNANRTFSIDTRGGRGIISLIAPLDYERKHLYQLRIIASVSAFL